MGNYPPMRTALAVFALLKLRIIFTRCVSQQNFHQLAVAFDGAYFCRYLAAVRVCPCNRHFAGFQLKLACTCGKIRQQFISFEYASERLHQWVQQIFC